MTNGAIYGARAAYIGGCEELLHHFREEFNIPALGTMAHSWVQMFDSNWRLSRLMQRYIPITVLSWWIPIMF